MDHTCVVLLLAFPRSFTAETHSHGQRSGPWNRRRAVFRKVSTATRRCFWRSQHRV